MDQHQVSTILEATPGKVLVQGVREEHLARMTLLSQCSEHHLSAVWALAYQARVTYLVCQKARLEDREARWHRLVVIDDGASEPP